MKSRIGALAVGLAADCDSPEADVRALMTENLKNANILPFVGFITPQGKWVGGYAGGSDEARFLKVLDEVEKSPLLEATDAVKKKVAGLAEKAGKAAEKGEWKSVLGAAREAKETTGRCESRETLEGFVKKAREWSAAQFDAAVKGAQSGGDLAEPRRILGDVKKQFSGEPEAAEAEAGLKALTKLSNLQAAEAAPNAQAGLREKVKKEFAASRWAAIFDPKPAARAEPPMEEPPK